MSRLAVALAALAGAAFLALGYTAARAGEQLRALQLGTQRPGPAQVVRASRLARDATLATPGRRAALELGDIEVRAGLPAAATRVAQDAVAAEPDNAEAWLLLSRAARDPTLARRAAQRVRELVPPVPPP